MPEIMFYSKNLLTFDHCVRQLTIIDSLTAQHSSSPVTGNAICIILFFYLLNPTSLRRFSTSDL